MMTTFCAIVGLVFLVLTNLAIIISFATPYWMVLHQFNRGLWAFCDDQTCTWVFQEQSYQLPGQGTTWWYVTQGLMCVGLALALFALLVATIALCCECKCCNSSHAVAGLLMLGFLTIGVAVVVFGICANKNLDVDMDSVFRHFSWSFWLATAASGLSLLSAIIYCCEGRARYSYSDTC